MNQSGMLHQVNSLLFFFFKDLFLVCQELEQIVKQSVIESFSMIIPRQRQSLLCDPFMSGFHSKPTERHRNLIVVSQWNAQKCFPLDGVVQVIYHLKCHFPHGTKANSEQRRNQLRCVITMYLNTCIIITSMSFFIF